MHLTLAYGTNHVSADLDWGRCLGVLDVADAPPVESVEHALGAALQTPIGMDAPLFASFRADETVGIVVADAFRHTAIDQLLPALLATLNRHGVRDESIHFFFSTGTHRPPTPEEQTRILGDGVRRRFRNRLHNHDAFDQDNLVTLGITSRGTPVCINRRLHDCDRILLTGAVMLHYFAGFGGGRKALVPGMAGAETIAHNHALNLDPDHDRLNPAVAIGRLDGNPVAEDLLEASRLVPVDGIVNTVLNRQGRIAGIFAGELDAAHRAAARFALGLYRKPIDERADLVIASAGNTRNFLQTHKALFNAYQAMKPGGRIILAARCEEGLGGNKFAGWLRLGTRDRIIAELRRHSEINGQTALSTIEKAPAACLVTDLPDDVVGLLGATKAPSFSEALARVREGLRHAGCADPTWYLMPSAAHTVPMME